jgi:L-malate glycosyltransferase
MAFFRQPPIKNREKSVLITIPCLLRGGTELQTLNLVKVLKSYGFNIMVLCYFEYDESIIIQFQNEGAVVRILKLNRKSRARKIIFKIYKEIRSVKPGIVHVQYMAPGALPIIAAKMAQVKIIFATVHQPWTPGHGRLSKLILRTVSFLCTRFICVSVSAEKSWFNSGRLFDKNKPVNLQSRHFTIYNSVEFEKIKFISDSAKTNQLKQELGIPLNEVLIGAVSRLRYEKGIDLLIEAFVQLIDEGASVHLLIAGSGPDELKLKEMVRGVSTKVTFYGEACGEKVIQLIAAMDIVVVPSRFEGFGLTAAEAMAVGKPVVSSDSFGLTEVVENHITGLCFKVGAILQLKENLKTLVMSSVLRNQYGEAGRERAKQIFDIEVFDNQIAKLYCG